MANLSEAQYGGKDAAYGGNIKPLATGEEGEMAFAEPGDSTEDMMYQYAESGYAQIEDLMHAMQEAGKKWLKMATKGQTPEAAAKYQHVLDVINDTMDGLFAKGVATKTGFNESKRKKMRIRTRRRK